jgi:transposase InsO family protein
MGLSLKTFERWLKTPCDQRQGPLTTPANKLSEFERAKVIEIATSKEYCDLSPSQIVPKLADKGEYFASESTFYRILKEEKMLTHRGKSKPSSANKPKPLMAMAPNEVWSWDITYLRSEVKGQFYYLYMFMDIFSRKIVGWDVHESEGMNYSSSLVTKIYEKENVTKGQVVLHSDNGGSMKGATMLATLQKLGIVPSFSRPSVSNDNPFSESLFKTVKYCPQFPSKPFSSVDAAKLWVDEFVQWYNCDHLHSGIKFVTPMSRHEGKDIEILKQRTCVYEKAKLKNPNRWSGKTRNWNWIEKVNLNNLHEEMAFDRKEAS